MAQRESDEILDNAKKLGGGHGGGTGDRIDASDLQRDQCGSPQHCHRRGHGVWRSGDAEHDDPRKVARPVGLQAGKRHNDAF